MFSQAKLIIAGVSLLVLLGGGFGLKWYIGKLKGDIETLKENNLVLKTSNEANLNTIGELTRQNAKNIEEMNSLQVRLDESNVYKEKLINTLQNHDLTKLSASKPGLIENRINDATKQLFTDFEIITNSN